jgi:hypothetical protein
MGVFTTILKAHLYNLFHKLEVDRAIIFGVLNRLWYSLTSLITIFIIVLYYSPVTQGYYYTFLNLLALQVFVELGLGNVIINFASHEWSRLRLNEQGIIVGEANALARLVSLGKYAFRWYAIGNIITTLGLGVAGYAFFSGTSSTNINLMGPWFLLCLLTGIKLNLIPAWSLLEGCNQVSNVYFYRLVEVIIVNISLWLSIIFKTELWALCAAVGSGLIWGGIFLLWKYQRFFSVFFAKLKVSYNESKKEIFQMQWRIALSWMSGYLIFYLFTPLMFKFKGAISAGQMGMTLALVGGPAGIAMLWINTKVPKFGILIARKEYAQLDGLFYRLTIISILIVFVGDLIIWSAVYLLYLSGSPLSLRILSPLTIGIFFLSSILMQISHCQASYLRAHKKEPFIIVSIGQGIFTSSSIWILGKHFGALGMSIGYLVVIILFVIPVGTIIWNRCRIIWHLNKEEL